MKKSTPTAVDFYSQTFHSFSYIRYKYIPKHAPAQTAQRKHVSRLFMQLHRTHMEAPTTSVHR